MITDRDEYLWNLLTTEDYTTLTKEQLLDLVKYLLDLNTRVHEEMVNITLGEYIYN